MSTTWRQRLLGTILAGTLALGGLTGLLPQTVSAEQIAGSSVQQAQQLQEAGQSQQAEEALLPQLNQQAQQAQPVQRSNQKQLIQQEQQTSRTQQTAQTQQTQEVQTPQQALASSAALPNGQGKKVLFDNAHAQTAGAADWVIDGAFSDFANGLKNDGFTVDSLERQIPYTFGEQAVTYDKLKNYDVFVIGEANIPYKKSEQDALIQFVRGGGGVFFIADHYNADRNKNRWDSSEVFNGYRRGAWDNPAKGMSAEEAASPAMQGLASSDWLADNFGLRFRYNALGDVNANDIVSSEQSFGITAGVSSVAVHAGSTLAILDPQRAKGLVYVPTGVPAWGNAVDSGVYNGGGRAEGPFAAISKLGLGKAAFIGDSSPVEDATPKYVREENGKSKTTYDGFKEVNDAAFLIQTVEWLANKESYTRLSEVPGLTLDSPTALLPSEQPANSVEPQAEPWAAPEAGYKWYDPTTFKPGSYGSSKLPDAKPVYGFVKQQQLPSEQEFQIRLTADGLTPGQTLSDLKVGIYLAGGTQIARFKSGDGTWSDYGYSPAFSVTANAAGHAAADLTVQLKPGSSGAASLRLKQGSSNVITESVTIANVPAEPLPTDGPAVPAVTSIAAARQAADGTAVTVQGTITTEPGLFGGQGFYLQDNSAGIYVFQNAAGYHAGDQIMISAAKMTYNGEIELESPVKIEKKGTADLPAPVIQSSLTDSSQGQRVTLQNVSIQNYKTAAPAGSFEFDAVPASGDAAATHVRVDGRTGVDAAVFQQRYPAGTTVNITGIASIFKGTYQLKAISEADVQLADTAAPVTQVEVDGKIGEAEYNVKAVTLTFSATDEGTGVARSEYRVNNGDWMAASSPVTLSDEGRFVVEYRSVDKAGNMEAPQTIVVRIDTQGPVIALPAGAKFYQTDAALPAVKVEDIGSSVKKTVYTLDGRAIESTGAVAIWTLSLGKHTLKVTATDAAGNSTSALFTLEETMDIEHLDELVSLGEAKQWITKPAEVKKLQSTVSAIQSAKSKQEQLVRLTALGTQVAAQTGKSITIPYSAMFLADLIYIGKQAI
ncbi:OmpL47-type beta-barrel domain-containing protein [Paenibacillus sp. SN-8-1]|uniref:OmpL47-type beta-barrel domain-containing protein n=1 Tax=Paenibacillus sp. SN-8-1 TaxID=3435409 RepID=UPI003D9A3CC2